MLLRVQEHRFAIVRNNWTFQEAPCSELSRKICICMLDKIQLTQELKATGHCRAQNLLIGCWKTKNVDESFLKKIIFSDEVRFQLDGFVNTQNCRILGAGNPRVIHEKPLHSQATVWCRFWAGGVIGPYFSNEARNAVTVNGVHYRNMIMEFLWPQLDGMEMEDMWSQQDGATCHTAHETTELLREKFPGCIISRNGNHNWPPRSCDLTPCDFFLWGFVKSRINANKP